MNAIVQRFDYAPGTLIEYEGYSIVVTGSGKDGLIVRDRCVSEAEKPLYFVLSDEKIDELRQRLDVVIDPTFGDEKPNGFVAESNGTQWQDRSAKDRLEAMQKEAWCLAANTVLKGPPYTVKRIDLNLSNIKQRADDRMRINELGSDKNGKYKARTWGTKSISNFCMKYFGMRRPHPKVLLSEKLKGNTTPKLPADVCLLLDKCCQSYLSKSQPSKASIVRFVVRRFRQVRRERLEAGNVRPFVTPHENTVYARLAKFSRLHCVIGREGYRAAQKEFSPTQHGVRALKPGELIELDFWKGDVFTLSQKSQFWDLLTPDIQKTFKEGKKKGRKNVRQRIWVCAALDVATRMVVGIGIAESPNARTVIEVLDMVLRDKSDLSQLAGCNMPWSQHCGIGTVIFDTGSEFFNHEVMTAILALGGSYILGRTAVPMDKPFVERAFGGLRTLFADEMSGKTGYSVDCLIDYDSAGRAVFDADEFRLLLVRYTVDFYPLREHEGLSGRPIDAWNDAQKYRIVPVPQPRVRRNATGLILERMLTKEGVRFLGIPFSSAELFPKAIGNGNRSVEVRVDPNDLREITILLDGKQVHLANQRPELEHHSIRTLMAAIKKMTATRPQDRIFYEYVLAQYADWFADKIALGIERRGLPSTEISKKEVDWFEQNFCLRLQIDKSPEQAVSADFEQLLLGGSGNGIYTADEVAAEQSRAAAERQNTVVAGREADSGPTHVSPPSESPANLGDPVEAGIAVSSKPKVVAKKKKPHVSPPARGSEPPKGKGRFK